MNKEIKRNKVTITQFCHQEDISESTYFRLRREGDLPLSYKIGRRVFMDQADIEQWRETLKARCA